MKRLCVIAVGVLSLWLGQRAVAQARDEDHRLDKVKSAFILNFLRYTRWPSDAFAHGDSPVVVLVVGRPDLVEYLEQIVKGQSIDGRPIEVRTLSPASMRHSDGHWRDQVRAAQAVFLPREHDELTGPLLAALSGANVLTISDATGFARAGGMLRLRPRQDRMAFSANISAIKATRLEVSSKLLKLAEIVHGGEP
jgi:hypothetical protein